MAEADKPAAGTPEEVAAAEAAAAAEALRPIIVVKKIIDKVRSIWAGDRAYIQHGSGGRSQRNEAIKREHGAGERIPYLMRKYQPSERRIIQILYD